MDENKKDNIVTGYAIATLTSYTDTPKPPPPPGFTSTFKTLQEWLYNICDTNQHERSIEEYQFVLSESPGNNMLTLFGFNTYYPDKDIVYHKTEFIPTNEYFPLPKEEYGNLSKEQLQEKILNQLKEFTKTDKFKNSFLSKGQSITTNFARKFWPE